MFSLQDVKNSPQPSRRHPYITYRMEENDRPLGLYGKASCAFAKTVPAERLHVPINSAMQAITNTVSLHRVTGFTIIIAATTI
ncbi:hypothetical protein D3OALGA1CA_1931 [Olavius algarvensis associated proteobacterium Delta 3]|nr:hypothetical protein D3OALGA1CA_1931 [Olavius algarvensis associated proteobacterium Delta 3]CAB5118503.1 hypothetical protein D3OALGB2SA_2824 [Olavius algarvensis associated proteobacterium Delta 3]